MPIRFACAQCDARVKTPDGSEGKKMKCPRCGHLQRVPEKGAAAESEPSSSPSSPQPAAAEPPVKPPADQTPPQETVTVPEQEPSAEPEAESSTEAEAEEADALAGLAAAGQDDTAPEVAPPAPEDAPSPSPQEPPHETPAAPPSTPRPRPIPQPQPSPATATEAPRAIPLSAHRPRPLPQPKPAAADSEAASGSALSAQVLSAVPSAAAPEARGRSLDLNAGDLPRARTRREIVRLRGQLQVLVWLCRGMAVIIAAGAVELMLHAGRQNASILTQLIFLIAGLATAGLAVAVGQLAAKVRQTLTGS